MRPQCIKKAREHTKLRAKQRYGLEFNKATRKECEEKLKTKGHPDVLLLFRESLTRYQYLVYLRDNIVLYCIYSKTLESIVTVLSINWIPKKYKEPAKVWIEMKIMEESNDKSNSSGSV